MTALDYHSCSFTYKIYVGEQVVNSNSTLSYYQQYEELYNKTSREGSKKMVVEAAGEPLLISSQTNTSIE